MMRLHFVHYNLMFLNNFVASDNLEETFKKSNNKTATIKRNFTRFLLKLFCDLCIHFESQRPLSSNRMANKIHILFIILIQFPS